jgi:hypothetical protein
MIPIFNEVLMESFPRLMDEVLNDTGIHCVLVSYLVAVVLGYVTTQISSKSVLAIVEVVAICLPSSASLVSFKAFRFFFGLLLFASFMTIHSKIFEKLLQSKETTFNDNIEKNGLSYDTLVKTIQELFLEHVMYVRKSHLKVCGNSYFSFYRLIYSIYTAILVDISTYLIREWIPLYISPSNQLFATSLIGGMWVLYCMDFAYSVAIMLHDAIGRRVPYEYRHCHPFISSSLSEFWGVRWNPVVGKLLQDSFYKPFRLVGFPRFLCVISCFIGSALLHSYPQHISTLNWKDTHQMGMFFIGQGGLVLAERFMIDTLGCKQFFEEKIMIKAASADTRVNWQWLVELLTVTSIVYSMYLYHEKSLGNMLERCVAICLISSSTFSFILLKFYVTEKQQSNNPDVSVPTNRGVFAIVICKLIGWIWTLCMIIALLPLFSMPVLHAVDTLYTKSYLVGYAISIINIYWSKSCLSR